MTKLHISKLRVPIILNIIMTIYILAFGMYAYLEASSTENGDIARLNSSLISSTAGSTGKCFTFWYHMYGPDINTLQIFTSVHGIPGPAVWSRFGSQGNRWRKGQVTLYARQPFTVSYRSNICNRNACA